MPEDLSFRRAIPGDEHAIASLHVASWQVGYRGIFDDAFLDELDPEDRVTRYDLDRPSPRTDLALVGGTLVGFVTTGPCRDEDAPGASELMALYVAPSSWGRGVGRALLHHAHDRMGEEAGTGVLWVLSENHRAIGLYGSEGWTLDGTRRREDPWGVVATVVRMRRPLR
jgi:GNAT superfamily N-acetyltransferase